MLTVKLAAWTERHSRPRRAMMFLRNNMLSGWEDGGERVRCL
jgi:hypothetical protein